MLLHCTVAVKKRLMCDIIHNVFSSYSKEVNCVGADLRYLTFRNRSPLILRSIHCMCLFVWVAYWLLPVPYSLLPNAYHQLSVSCHLLSTAICLLSVVYCFLSGVLICISCFLCELPDVHDLHTCCLLCVDYSNTYLIGIFVFLFFAIFTFYPLYLTPNRLPSFLPSLYFVSVNILLPIWSSLNFSPYILGKMFFSS